MATESEKISEGATSESGGKQTPTEGTPKCERAKATRHPRWTRQETLVLIEAKKLVENGEQICRYRSTSGLVQSDAKWDLVSSFCQQQGVQRGAVQCRKRWGNLLTDYRKIKKWESNIKDETESFWILRNDVRKEKKLPGFFDSVVYNVLDGGVCTAAAFPLTLVKMVPKVENGDQVCGVLLEQCKEGEDDDEEEEDDEAIVDSEKIGWSTEEEDMEKTAGKETGTTGSLKKTPTITLPTPEKQQQPSCNGNHIPGQEGYKRQRLAPEDCEDNKNFDSNIIKVLRRNSNILKAHIGAQNINYQLARDQQKEQTDSLVAALGKLADAMTKIADKL